MFKITYKEHVRFVGELLISAFLSHVCMVFLVYFKMGSLDFKLAFYFSIAVFVFLNIPKLLLHINYYLTNRNMIVYFYDSQKQIRVICKARNIKFNLSDIQNIIEYKTYPNAENRNGWMPWDDYHYSLVELYNGDKFYFTSLILPNLHLPIESERKILKKRFYPAIW